MRKKRWLDSFSDIVIFLIRPVVDLFLVRAMDVRSSGITIEKKREPFILISNHFNTWDSFIVMKHIKYPIRFVATEIGFLDFSKKISMGFLAQTIRKRVGKPDLQAVKKIFYYLHHNYAIGLYPEGDNTFYGETVDIYASTGKLLKKANVDVIMIKQAGGYLSQPRWADYFSKRGIVYTHTDVLISKEELKKLTTEEIQNKVKNALYHNDYEWQRRMMLPYNRRNRAEGIERLIYICNQCESVLSVYGEGHQIKCTHCGTIGEIDEYEFIDGNRFDNLVDYNHYQYSKIDIVRKATFEFPITLAIIDTVKLKNKKLGKFQVVYKEDQLMVSNKKMNFQFDIKKIKYPVNTMRHSFSFDYEGVSYNFLDIRHQFVLYELCRHINGSYKE